MSAKEAFSKYAEGVVVIRTSLSIGTGFFIDSRGLILTNHHVINDPTPITVDILPPPGGKGTRIHISDVTVVGLHPHKDIALLRVKLPPGYLSKPLRIDYKRSTETGSVVYAIGNSLGFLERSISEGIVSADIRKTAGGMIQFTAPVTHGNSGGPLIDDSGFVVGMVTCGIENVSGLNFAIPISDCMPEGLTKTDMTRIDSWMKQSPLDAGETLGEFSEKLVPVSLESAKEMHRIRTLQFNTRVSALTVHPKTGDLWIVDAEHGQLAVIHTESGELRSCVPIPCQDDVKFRWDPESKRLLATSFSGGCAMIFDGENPALLSTVFIPSNIADAVLIDESTLALSISDKLDDGLLLYDLGTNTNLVYYWLPFPADILSFSPERKILLACALTRADRELPVNVAMLRFDSEQRRLTLLNTLSNPMIAQPTSAFLTPDLAIVGKQILAPGHASHPIAGSIPVPIDQLHPGGVTGFAERGLLNVTTGKIISSTLTLSFTAAMIAFDRDPLRAWMLDDTGKAIHWTSARPEDSAVDMATATITLNVPDADAKGYIVRAELESLWHDLPPPRILIPAPNKPTHWWYVPSHEKNCRLVEISSDGIHVLKTHVLPFEPETMALSSSGRELAICNSVQAAVCKAGDGSVQLEIRKGAAAIGFTPNGDICLLGPDSIRIYDNAKGELQAELPAGTILDGFSLNKGREWILVCCMDSCKYYSFLHVRLDKKSIEVVRRQKIHGTVIFERNSPLNPPMIALRDGEEFAWMGSIWSSKSLLPIVNYPRLPNGHPSHILCASDTWVAVAFPVTGDGYPWNFRGNLAICARGSLQRIPLDHRINCPWQARAFFAGKESLYMMNTADEGLAHFRLASSATAPVAPAPVNREADAGVTKDSYREKGYLKLKDITAYRETSSYRGGKSVVKLLVDKTRDRAVAMDTRMNCLHILQIGDGSAKPAVSLNFRPIDMAFSPDGRHLLVIGVGDAKPTLIYDADSLELDKSSAARATQEGLFWISKEQFVIHGDRGSFDVVNVKSGNVERSIPFSQIRDFSGVITPLPSEDKQRWLAVVDNRVQIWQYASRALMLIQDGTKSISPPSRFLFPVDERTFFYSNHRCSLDTLEPVGTPLPISLSDLSLYIAVGKDPTGNIRVMDVESGEATIWSLPTTNTVFDAKFGATDERLIVADYSGLRLFSHSSQTDELDLGD